jgi:hypothetical protein
VIDIKLQKLIRENIMSDSARPLMETSTNPSTPKVAIKNWKTTAIGAVLCCSGFVVFSPKTFGGENAPLVQVCKYITSGGLAALGITAKDFNVSGKDKK